MDMRIWERIIIALVASAIALAVGWGIVTLAKAIDADEHQYRTWCMDRGGHVTDSTIITSNVSFTGKPGIGVATVEYCLTTDGRIIDIRS